MPVYTYSTLDDPSATTNDFQSGRLGIGINDTDQIVGWSDNNSRNHGFLLSGSTFTTLDNPLAPIETIAKGINNAGRIVGTYFDNGGEREHGFAFDINKRAKSSGSTPM